MTGRTCALPGCSKPAWDSQGRHVPHLACGRLHHNLLMAGRFNPSAPHPYNSILDRNNAGLCALYSCSKPPWPGHSWCTQSHYLDWLKEFFSSFKLDQICKLPHCTMHVFVDEDNNPSQFCGWSHRQEFVKLDASQKCDQSRFLGLIPSQHGHSSPTSSEDECGGHVPSIELLMRSLKGFANSGIAPSNIKVDTDFFSKHPWEVCREKKGQAYVSIVQCSFLSKGKRALGTKDGYHWKQTGRPTMRDCGFLEKNYVYQKMRKGQEKYMDDPHEQMVYRMKEYTLENLKAYSLVICKEHPSSHRKQSRGKPMLHGEGSSAEVNDLCSLGSMTSNLGLLDDEFFADSFFEGLQPLDDSI